MPIRLWGVDPMFSAGKPTWRPLFEMVERYELGLFSEECTGHISVGASSQALGIYRFTANGTVGYAGHTATEDRAIRDKSLNWM